ncbi:hypothetical protein RCL1_006674 [Eukaryota sp. TZLM3-RCL]
MKIFAFVVLCFCIVTSASVVPLNNSNFDKVVTKSPVPVFVKFFSPSCPHCQNIVPTYNGLSKNFSPVALIAEVNCQTDNQICGKYQIQGVPSFKLFYGAGNSRVADYGGARDGKSMAKFIDKHLPTRFIKTVDEKNVSSIIGSSKPVFILDSSKNSYPAVLKSLSLKYRKSALFYTCSTPGCTSSLVSSSKSSTMVAVINSKVHEISSEPTTSSISAFVNSLLNKSSDEL